MPLLEKKKLLVWSYGSFFKKKILPFLTNSNHIEVEKILTKKKIKNKTVKIFNNKKKFFTNIRSKFIYINSNQKDHYENIKYSLKKN